MGNYRRSVQETAYEAESELLRLAGELPRPEWHRMSLWDRQVYSLALAERFAVCGGDA